MTVPSLPWSQRARHSVEPPISYLMEQGISNPDIISLAAGLVDQESLPVDEIRRSLDRVCADPVLARESLQYATTWGLHSLREHLANRLRTIDHAALGETSEPARHAASPGRILIGTGSQQLLYILAEVLLDPGDIVLAGVPSYFVYMGAVESFGAKVVGVASDADGMDPDDLERKLVALDRQGDLSRVKFIYDVTYFNNPTGLSLALHRRPTILAILKRWSIHHRLLFVEDAAYRELRYAGVDQPSMLAYDHDGQHVVYAGTFSKPLAPGIRTGYVVGPDDLLEKMVRQKGHHDFGSPSLNQQLVLAMLETGDYDRHLQTLKSQYAAKLAAMLHRLEEELGDEEDRVKWTMPLGGLYVWVELPPRICTEMPSLFFRDAISAGVLYVPGNFCYPTGGEDQPRHFLRLSFGHQPLARCEEGTSRLARVIHHHLQE